VGTAGRRGAYGEVCKDECTKVKDRRYYLCNTETYTDSYGRTKTDDLCSPRDGIDAYGDKCIGECKIIPQYKEYYCGIEQCSLSA
jgi:hypothetical protein